MHKKTLFLQKTCKIKSFIFPYFTGFLRSMGKTVIRQLMLVLFSFISFTSFIYSLIKNFKEILNRNADKDINDEIYTIVKDVEKEYNFEDSITRVSKIGKELRIEIDFVFNEESKLNKLEEMDNVREYVYSNMSDIKLDKWLNINFTGDKKWAV